MYLLSCFCFYFSRLYGGYLHIGVYTFLFLYKKYQSLLVHTVVKLPHRVPSLWRTNTSHFNVPVTSSPPAPTAGQTDHMTYVTYKYYSGINLLLYQNFIYQTKRMHHWNNISIKRTMGLFYSALQNQQLYTTMWRETSLSFIWDTSSSSSLPSSASFLSVTYINKMNTLKYCIH